MLPNLVSSSMTCFSVPMDHTLVIRYLMTYFFIAVIRHHSEGNVPTKDLIGDFLLSED